LVVGDGGGANISKSENISIQAIKGGKLQSASRDMHFRIQLNF
jgi:hypothetical protein